MLLIHNAYAGPLDTAPSMTELVMGTINAILGFAGSIAVLVIVIAGILYITSGGDTLRTEHAKKTMIGGIVGLVVVVILCIIKI